MTDAEKKWDEWDSQRALAFDLDPDCTIEQLCKDSREAYKEALREAIENKIMGRASDNDMSRRFYKNFGSLTMRELNDIIDSVTPKE